MSLTNFTVASISPIAIYPSGLQGSATVTNNGTVTAYLSDTANGGGYPLKAGNALLWNASTPLYAAVGIVGQKTTLLVMDTAGVLPLAQVTATIPDGIVATIPDGVTVDGSVNVLNSATTLAISSFTYAGTAPGYTGYYNTGAYSVAGYQTVFFSAAINALPATNEHFDMTAVWSDINGNQLGIDTYGLNAYGMEQTEITMPVRGPFLTLIIQDNTAGIGVGGLTMTLRLTGLTQILPKRYYQSGSDGESSLTGNCVYGITTVALASATKYPGTFAGRATLTLESDGVTNTGNGLVMQIRNAMGTRIYAQATLYSARGFDAVTVDAILPNEPLQIRVTNRTAVTLIYNVSVSYGAA